MKKYVTLLLILAAVRCFASEGVDTFRAGLNAFQANGPDALLRTWYSSEETNRIFDLKKRLIEATQNLGEVIDTEVFAPKSLGRHVQRLYGVIYFRKHPLWLRAEYYTIDGQSGFISLEFSREANDILPLEIATIDR